MLKLPLFRIRPFSLALGAAGLSFMAGGANIYVMPFFLQLLLNFSPQDAGLIMLAGPLTLSIAAPVGGILSEKVSTRWIASLGLLITSTGYFLFSFLGDDWSWKEVVWRSALVSLGFGLFQSPNSSSALNAAPISERGVASSLIAFMRNLGLITGIALGAAVWYSIRNRYSVLHGVAPVSTAAQVAGMQWVYRVMSGLAIMGAFISFIRGSNLLNQKSENKYLYRQNT